MFSYQILQIFSKKEKKILSVALTVLLFSTILLIANFINQNTVSVPVKSGQYIEGVIGQPKFINPIIANTDIDRDLSQIVFSDLTDLLDHYNVSADGKTWDVFLKSDLLWSDDKPLNSDDVVFTVETIQDPETNSPLFSTWQGIVADRISELEIEFTLRTPYAFFLDNLKDLKIIPKHIYGAIPSSNFKLSGYNLEPVGNGPYKYENYNIRKDGFITNYNFIINPNFSGKKPFIQKFSVNFFQGTNELISAFNSRKIDGFGNLNPENIDDLKLSRQILELKMPRYYAIFLNQSKNEILKDQKIREILNKSVDKDKIIREIFNEKAEIVNQPITSTIEGYDKQIGKEEFSLKESNELLEKEGWKINSDTGTREKNINKNMVKLEFQLVVPQINSLIRTAELIKTDWEKIGIKITLLELNPTDINNEIIKNRDYEMLMFGNILRNNPDIFSFWHSSERFYPGLNLALYQDKQTDSLIEIIKQNLDGQKRLDEINNLQSMISEKQPAIFLFSPYYLYASVKNFGGLENKVLVVPSDRFKNINEWYLETTRIFK